jgi:hypothetical protein
MAESPAITEGVLKMKITELLQALHVEIEDMSGISPSLLDPTTGEVRPQALVTQLL